MAVSCSTAFAKAAAQQSEEAAAAAAAAAAGVAVVRTRRAYCFVFQTSVPARTSNSGLQRGRAADQPVHSAAEQEQPNRAAEQCREEAGRRGASIGRSEPSQQRRETSRAREGSAWETTRQAAESGGPGDGSVPEAGWQTASLDSRIAGGSY